MLLWQMCGFTCDEGPHGHFQPVTLVWSLSLDEDQGFPVLAVVFLLT